MNTQMIKTAFTTIIFSLLMTAFGQNGMKNGGLFLLRKDKNTISINSFEKDEIKELKTFPVSEKSIFSTDQREKVAILDTSNNKLTLFDIYSSNQIELDIPFDIKPKSVLLSNKNLFVGGEKSKEILIQYHLSDNKWHQLEIPKKVVFFGKAVDDLVVNDSFLIAIDDLVMPKYILFYHLNLLGKLQLSHYKALKANGSYENIYAGRITDKYLGLLSGTISGYSGAANHITIYQNLELTNSFSISSKLNGADSHQFTDFLIVKDKLVVACKQKGLGVLEIKESYFNSSEETSSPSFNTVVSSSNVEYTNYGNSTIIQLTLIPNTSKIVLTLEDENGLITYEVIEV